MMTSANRLVERAVGENGPDHVPPRVREIVERHRQTLLNLANALLVSGRDEDEVIQIIQKASESFSNTLESETEGLRS